MRLSVILDVGLLAWFILLAGTEFVVARRRRTAVAVGDSRLVTNFALGAVILFANSLVPIAKVGSSLVGQWAGAGLAVQFAWPWTLSFGALLIADSLLGYWTHRAMHAIPLFWRVHRVHHSDDSVDISTSFRNHPLELLITIPTSAVVVLAIGAPVSVVVTAQTIMFAASVFHHADIELPMSIERKLALVLVTPRVHRLHHNPERRVHDSNYGDLVTLWDRLFGSFTRPGPRGPVGLDRQVARPDGLLQQIWSPLYSA